MAPSVGSFSVGATPKTIGPLAYLERRSVVGRPASGTPVIGLLRRPFRHRLVEPARAPNLASQRERPSELDADDRPCLAAPSSLEHPSGRGEPRDIAARPRQARHETVRCRVADTNENNREGRRRFLGGQGGRGASASHDDINLERSQFRRESGQPLGLPLGISVLDQDVLPFDVTEVTQSLEEGLSEAGVRRPGRSPGSLS